MWRDAPCPHSSMHLSGQTRWSAPGNACEPEGRLYSGSWAVSAAPARDPVALRPAVTDGLPLSEIAHVQWPRARGVGGDAEHARRAHTSPARRILPGGGDVSV